MSENMRFQKNPRSCGRHITDRNVAGKPVSCGWLYLPITRRTVIVVNWLSLPQPFTSYKEMFGYGCSLVVFVTFLYLCRRLTFCGQLLTFALC